MLTAFRQRQPGIPLHGLVLHAFGKLLCATVCIAAFRARAFNQRNVPQRGAVLLAANHQSYLDPPLVGCMLINRHVDFVARAGLFRVPIFGWLIRAVGAAPVEENGSDTAAIRTFLARLAMDRAIVIFPEGSRSPDGMMRPFKRGVALLVKKAGCPVIPVGVEGCFDAWPRAGLPRVGRRVMVNYGTPISAEDLLRDGADAGLERLRREIERLRAECAERLRAESGGTYPPARHAQKGQTNAR